ncbi:hypothetical protein ZWY2020_037947 [Hordeum vulgare]|nr:hypothetical protein ZWY2020_037947 [Hordeum vulgare]
MAQPRGSVVRASATLRPLDLQGGVAAPAWSTSAAAAVLALRASAPTGPSCCSASALRRLLASAPPSTRRSSRPPARPRRLRCVLSTVSVRQLASRVRAAG